MDKVQVREHEWMAISLEPVLVVWDPVNSEPVIFGDPDTPAETQYGCRVCDEVLAGNFGTECEGEEE